MNFHQPLLFGALSLALLPAAFSADDPTPAVKSLIAAPVNQAAESWLRNLLSAERGVTEIGITGIENGDPVYNVLLVRPLTESADLQHSTFMQGSAFHQDDTTTLNLGLGYRRLVSNNRLLLGLNAFYDHEFPNDHQRMSIGGEIRSTVGEINANWYKGLSGWKDAGNNTEEKALGGYDLELAVAVPYVPTAHVRAKTFNWDGVDGAADLQGQTYSVTGALLPGVSAEIGQTQYNDNRSNDNFVMLTYTFGGDRPKSTLMPRIIDTAWQMESMEDRRFEKVRRENRIVKATRSTLAPFAVSVSGF
ncbi:MAG: inverse autotransporter beta domain-containing protein [Gammaproteobacteria bacterium]|nr:inverse autotransporter beta domain-containing protein [Gammaproteobacteria bacterium]MBU1654291.1 inverse autotransporter beta domain-containing protein [Gammaproteobacteria bacterium]MBU1961234.1 inverse autotransporter beta domain-containing protein [Gammaproteobacteria bacterium]